MYNFKATQIMKNLNWIKAKANVLEGKYINLEQVQDEPNNSERFAIEVAKCMTVIEHQMELLEEVAGCQLTDHPILMSINYFDKSEA